MAWQQQREGHAVRHRLAGTELSVLALGGQHAAGYGAHGRARMAGRARQYVVLDGDRAVGSWPTLRDARAQAERRAA